LNPGPDSFGEHRDRSAVEFDLGLSAAHGHRPLTRMGCGTDNCQTDGLFGLDTIRAARRTVTFAQRMMPSVWRHSIVRQESHPVFFSRIPQKTLAVVAKSLATMLHAGVPLLKSLQTLSRKTGDARCRRSLSEIHDAVRQGVEISTAMRDQRGYYPELAIDMVAVGEQTGSLPEVLDGLADHYENNVRLRRTFLTTIAWPVIQLVAAIFVVGLLIWILGAIGESRTGPGGKPVDMLGWGLLGTSGALIWFGMSFGTVFAVLGGYFLVSHVFHQQRFLDTMLLGIPVVGGCMQSFAIARFSWVFSLTQQTGMPIARCLDASFRATGNGAFQGAGRDVQDRVLAGDELSIAFAATRLFPDDYVQMVEVAESSGTVPETLERLSPQFEAQARRSLSALATTLGWVVWLVVAVFIIFIIFSIVLQYIGMINNAAAGNF
jgi:type IV pilus assembly protein PilC